MRGPIEAAANSAAATVLKAIPKVVRRFVHNRRRGLTAFTEPCRMDRRRWGPLGSETLDAKLYRGQRGFCHALADATNATQPLLGRRFFLTKACE
jgi:hypothetical protein